MPPVIGGGIVIIRGGPIIVRCFIDDDSVKSRERYCSVDSISVISRGDIVDLSISDLLLTFPFSDITVGDSVSTSSSSFIVIVSPSLFFSGGTSSPFTIFEEVG